MAASMVAFSVLGVSLGLLLGPGTEPSILHQPLDCIAPGDYPVIQAAIAGDDVRTAKVYFRSVDYPKFYYVEMTPSVGSAGAFEVVLPRPSAETHGIIYYIEAVDVTFSNSVGTENAINVSPDCSAQRTKETDAPPEIVVGATEAGMASTPPGFETVGIIGTITSAGLSTALGGGTGVGTAAVVGGVAAGVGGGVVVATVSQSAPPEDEPTGSAPPEPPETPSATPTGPPPATPPSPPGPGPAPTPTPPEPPPTPAPTPPSPSPPPPPAPSAPVQACFTYSIPGGSCNLKLDASCSSGPIVSYDWEIDPEGNLGGETTPSGVRVNRAFPQCSGERVEVKLTVSPSSGPSDSENKTITLPVTFQTQGIGTLEPCEVTAELLAGASDGSLRGIVLAGQRVISIDDTQPFPIVISGTTDAVIEAALGSPTVGSWRFDLERCDALEPGSLRVESGQVLALEPDTVVFRLTGNSGERLRLRFRLSP